VVALGDGVEARVGAHGCGGGDVCLFFWVLVSGLFYFVSRARIGEGWMKGDLNVRGPEPGGDWGESLVMPRTVGIVALCWVVRWLVKLSGGSGGGGVNGRPTSGKVLVQFTAKSLTYALLSSLLR
jgi:hypothetical protein